MKKVMLFLCALIPYISLAQLNDDGSFEISATSLEDASLIIRNNSYTSANASGQSSLQFEFQNHGGPKIQAVKFTTNTTGLRFYTEYGYNIAQLGLVIRPSLNGSMVGIGTEDTRGYKLAVNGSIISEELKIATYQNWPDYVFMTDYELPTLNEVAAHIEKKGTLINMPNADEVKEGGIYVGEMNAKLLEKIEELTLYIIKQNNEIRNLNSLLNEMAFEKDNLKDMLLKLESRIDDLEGN